MFKAISHKAGAAAAKGPKNTHGEEESDRNTRMNEMKLVSRQPRMPSFINFNSDF